MSERTPFAWDANDMVVTYREALFQYRDWVAKQSVLGPIMSFEQWVSVHLDTEGPDLEVPDGT